MRIKANKYAIKNNNGTHSVYSKYIDPQKNREERKFFDVTLDLKEYADQKN